MTPPIRPLRRKSPAPPYRPVWVHPDIHADLKNIAEREETSMNEVLRYLVALAQAGQIRFPKEPER